MYEITIEDLLEKTIKTSSCWLWTGYINSNGYGQLSKHSTHDLVHRLSYRFFVGEIPDKMNVCHSCDIRSCLNPKHLWVGSQEDNMHDMAKKDRGSKGRKDYSEKDALIPAVYESFRWNVLCLGKSRIQTALEYGIDIAFARIIIKSTSFEALIEKHPYIQYRQKLYAKSKPTDR